MQMSEETTTAHLLINGSWLSGVVTVEERRYGPTTTRLPDLTWPSHLAFSFEVTPSEFMEKLYGSWN